MEYPFMPKHPQDIGKAAIKEHVASAQSTHGQAPGASAARLIRLLREVYPSIKTGILTQAGPLSMLSEDIIGSQGTLIQYIKDKIVRNEEDLGIERENPHIASTIHVVDMIDALTDITPEAKKKIWTQMESIAATCPGIDWDDNHATWSTNRIYNSMTSKDEFVTASPAETLNLLCAAISDTHRFIVSESGDEVDLRFRLESLCSVLLRLQEQKDIGQHEVCSAGRQHEMLFLLNKAYLSKPREEGGEPIELIENTETFLVDSLSVYVESQLKRFSAQDRAKVVLDWIRWQTGLIEADESPLITRLKADQGDDWRLGCKQYLIDRCRLFGLNPSECKLDELIAGLDYLPVPATQYMLTPVIEAIMRTKPLNQRPFSAEAVAGEEDEWDRLIALSNMALALMKSLITPETCESHSIAIRDFYNAIEMMQSLYHYKDLKVFIGEEEGRFNRAREAMQSELLGYFNEFSLEKRLSPAFEAKKATYLGLQKGFADPSQMSFVTNLFASLINKEDYYTFWDRLEALKTPSMEKHPLILSDVELGRWQQESIMLSPEGMVTIHQSPYQINRLLLQGFLVPPREWTPFYRDILKLITQWLLEPPSLEDSLVLNTFKASYPPFILDNLLLLSLVMDPSFENQQVKERLCKIFDDISSHGFLVYSEMNIFVKLLTNSKIGGALSSEDVDYTLRFMSGHLSTFIKNGSDLCELFALPLDKLSHASRQLIFGGVKDQLSRIITEHQSFIYLLSLKSELFGVDQKEALLGALREQLCVLVNTKDKLGCLLDLPIERFNADHRALLLAALQGHWITLVKSAKDLVGLLSYSDQLLKADSKEQIWHELEGHLDPLIRNVRDVLTILGLPEDCVSLSFKTHVLECLGERLGSLTSSIKDFYDLLKYPKQIVTIQQRELIWRHIESHLDTLIPPLDDLVAIYSLSDEILDMEKKNKIFNAFKYTLDTLTSGAIVPIYRLLKLPLDKFQIEQREILLKGINSHWKTLCIDGYYLVMLLKLPQVQLSSDFRTNILEELKGQMPRMIQNIERLHSILLLPEEQLNKKNRELIMTSISEDLKMEYLSRYPHSIGFFSHQTRQDMDEAASSEPTPKLSK